MIKLNKLALELRDLCNKLTDNLVEQGFDEDDLAMNTGFYSDMLYGDLGGWTKEQIEKDLESINKFS